MKEIIFVYSNFCISSKKSLSLLESIINEHSNIVLHKVEFSFNDPLVKRHKINITPTFIIDDKIVFVGIPKKQDLIKKLF